MARRYETDDVLAEYEKRLAEAGDGENVEIRSSVQVMQVEIQLTLGKRGGDAEPVIANEQTYFADVLEDTKDSRLYRAFIDKVVDANGIRAQYDDLLKRLAATHEAPDAFRRTLMAYVHRDPFKLESAVQHFAVDNAKAVQDNPFYAIFGAHLSAMRSMDIFESVRPARLRTGLTPEEHIEQIVKVFAKAETLRRQAFVGVTEEEMEFLSEQRHALTEVFVEHIYLHIDRDRERWADNQRLLKIAEKIDYTALAEAQFSLLALTRPNFVLGLKTDLETAYKDKLDEGIIKVFETPFGPMAIGGKSRSHWYREYSYALIIDLGGKDFYSGNSGSGNYHSVVYEKNKEGEENKKRALAVPIGVVLDLGGDDVYESTRSFEIGSGSLGCGLLFDLEGDDQYVSIQWGQASSFMGCGTLIDMAGDDVYRGRELCQAASIFGISVLIDADGNDRYEGNEFCQALAGAGSCAMLLEGGGDDTYYSKGSRPTNYGDAGIYDGWSQGCAIGFRSFSSGGVAVLADASGVDRYEAGNFSQGGGYYFGLGILTDCSTEDDHYIGSRYNQGFSAHQAVGAFYDEGGDDLYQTRQAVAQGLAWDECVTFFIDANGNDTYEGSGFSQGASAHNSFCLFHDRYGSDRYYCPQGQARAGGNDYHGGYSFSLFLDTGGATDYYDASGSRDDYLRLKKEYGLFADLPVRLEYFMKIPGWLEMIEFEDK
ncbi:MAG: hypothetical protein U5N86_07050 [Planctomycetota bacterium]|nr:hypothetical protein [Planctomycetota bacterium]